MQLSSGKLAAAILVAAGLAVGAYAAISFVRRGAEPQAEDSARQAKDPSVICRPRRTTLSIN